MRFIKDNQNSKMLTDLRDGSTNDSVGLNSGKEFGAGFSSGSIGDGGGSEGGGDGVGQVDVLEGGIDTTRAAAASAVAGRGAAGGRTATRTAGAA